MDAVDVALTNERNGYSSFDNDYTPSPEVVERVNAVFDYIEANPQAWDQDTYGNHLTETNCFMGILCRLDGYETERYPYFEDNGDVPQDFYQFSVYDGMALIEMFDPEENSYGHEDRGKYIANFQEVPVIPAEDVTLAYPYRHPTLDEMRERVSIAMNHDFRKKNDVPNAEMDFNDRIHDQM